MDGWEVSFYETNWGIEKFLALWNNEQHFICSPSLWCSWKRTCKTSWKAKFAFDKSLNAKFAFDSHFSLKSITQLVYTTWIAGSYHRSSSPLLLWWIWICIEDLTLQQIMKPSSLRELLERPCDPHSVLNVRHNLWEVREEKVLLEVVSLGTTCQEIRFVVNYQNKIKQTIDI